MDISNPLVSVIPGGRGAVLTVLARTGRPLSGRRVAELAGQAVGVARTAEILAELTRAGIVTADSHPPAILYSLNDEHLAASAIRELCAMRSALIDRIQAEIATWDAQPAGAWMFGSAARGDGGLDSDVDVLVVQPTGDFDEQVWESAVLELGQSITRWTGNGGSVLDFTDAEIAQLATSGERLIEEIRRDGIHVAGRRHLVTRRLVTS